MMLYLLSGQADGFKLDVLGKIRDVKMNNGGTMLTFIVRKYIKVYQEDNLDDESVQNQI